MRLLGEPKGVFAFSVNPVPRQESPLGKEGLEDAAPAGGSLGLFLND